MCTPHQYCILLKNVSGKARSLVRKMNMGIETIVDLPLKGEWVAPHTPADRVPSHGTDALGQRYAFDMYRTDVIKKRKFHNESWLKYFTVGISIDKCFCYKERIYSPVDGRVAVVKDGVKEPQRLQPLLDLFKVILRSVSIFLLARIIPKEKIDLQRYIGNYVIIEFDGKYAFFAHISPGSICIKEGQYVRRGDMIGLVGHSGSSTAPHLHFHCMDSQNLLKAKGIPIVFKKYEVFHNSQWIVIENSIPTGVQRFRSTDEHQVN